MVQFQLRRCYALALPGRGWGGWKGCALYTSREMVKLGHGSSSAAPTLRSGDTRARLGVFVEGCALHTSHGLEVHLPHAVVDGKRTWEVGGGKSRYLSVPVRMGRASQLEMPRPRKRQCAVTFVHAVAMHYQLVEPIVMIEGV